MAEHEISVASHWHNDGGSGLSVQCSCGWEQDFDPDSGMGSNGWATLAEINDAAAAHLAGAQGGAG